MIVVNNGRAYERHALEHVLNYTNLEQIRSLEESHRHVIYWPYTYPCLIGLYTTLDGGREYVSAIECNKRTAKSIVYPHTNKCNDDQWYKLNTAADYDPIVEYLKAKHRCGNVSHVNRSKMELASLRNEPFLTRGVPCHDGKTLKMFLLEKEDAKKLVYYKNNGEKLKKKNMETWKKNLAKKAAERFNNIERLVNTYRDEEGDIGL